MSTQDNPTATVSRREATEEAAEDVEESDLANQHCEDCGGELVSEGAVPQKGYHEVYCQDCGLVQQVDALERSVRDRLASDGTPERQSGPQTNRAYAEKGLGTTAPDPRKESDLSFSQRKAAQRLFDRTVELEGQGKGRALRRGMAEVRRICGRLDLPGYVRDDAGKFVQTASDEDLLPGHNVDDVAAAAVYAAAYVGGVPRPYEAVARHTHCDVDELRDEHLHLAGNLQFPQKLPSASELVAWYASELRDATDIQFVGSHARLATLAERLLEQVDNPNGFANRAPSTRAGAALYVAGTRLELGLTQNTVAGVVGVNADTISDAYPDLAEATGGGN